MSLNMSIYLIFYLIFFLIIFILFTPNAVHALIALILIFMNIAMFLFILNLPFLGFSYILVYIGAICVLLIYICILLNLRIFPLRRNVYNYLFLLLFTILIPITSFITSYINIIQNSILSTFVNNVYRYILDIQLLASYLFVSHGVYLLFAVFILLLALVLSIFLIYDISTYNNMAYIMSIDSMAYIGIPLSLVSFTTAFRFARGILSYTYTKRSVS